jgi:Mn2+/Fe2+ NRAMP family transporter
MTPPEPLLEAVEGPPVALPEGPSPLERMFERGRVRATLGMLAPAFVAAVAYIDPGNFATNVQGGARFGYQLLWVVLAANLIAMLVQYLSAKLGIVSGRNLPELCRARFPRWVSWGLWIQAEVMAMAIPMFVRRAVTMLPALVILAIGVSTTDALVLSQVVLSFGIQFALIPLVMMTNRREIMARLPTAACSSSPRSPSRERSRR